jgi:hypothetical protein
MPKFKETGRVERTIQAASPEELARQAQFNAFAFDGSALGSGVTGAEIASILRRQGSLQQLSPGQRQQIQAATFGGLSRGFAPGIEAATNQIGNTLNARGIRGSTGALFAGAAGPLAQALGQAQRQSAQAELQLPFQIQQAGLQQAGALQGLRGQDASFAQFSLQRDLQERAQTSTTRQFKKKRGFFSSIGAALGGALLGGLTGGIGTGVLGAAAGLFGDDTRDAALGNVQAPAINLNTGTGNSGNAGTPGGFNPFFAPTGQNSFNQ